MADDIDQVERIAKRLKKARQESGLTQAEVAKKAGISENHYAQIERGEKNTTVTRFLNIITAIGVSSTEILGR